MQSINRSVETEIHSAITAPFILHFDVRILDLVQGDTVLSSFVYPYFELDIEQDATRKPLSVKEESE